MFNRLTPAVKNLLIINGIIFVLSALTRGSSVDVFDLGAMRHPFSDKFHIWQPITHMFLHGDIGHIFGNMLGLLFLGPLLEMVWGTKRFYLFYFVCGLGASALHLGVQTWELMSLQSDVDFFMNSPTAGNLFPILEKALSTGTYTNGMNAVRALQDGLITPADVEFSKSVVQSIMTQNENIPVVGASGAIYGIILGAAMLFPNTEVYIYFLFPVKLKWIALFLAGFAIYRGFANQAGDNIAHWAHLGGMLFAYIFIRYWKADRNQFY